MSKFNPEIWLNPGLWISAYVILYNMSFLLVGAEQCSQNFCEKFTENISENQLFYEQFSENKLSYEKFSGKQAKFT